MTKDEHESPMNVTAAHVSVAPEMSATVDEEDSDASTVEDHGRAECFRTPRQHDKDSRRKDSQHQEDNSGGHRVPGYRTTNGDSQKSDDGIGLAGDKGYSKGVYHTRRSSDGVRRPDRSISGITKREDVSHKKRTRCRKEKLGQHSKGGEDQSEINADSSVDEVDIGNVGSPTRRHSGTDDTDGEGDRCSPMKSEPPGRRRSLEVSGTRNKVNGTVEEKEEIEQRSELHPINSARARDSDTTIEQERGIAASGGEVVVVQEEAHGGESTKRSRIFSSDNENVETIELSEGIRHNDAQHPAKDCEQQQAGGRTPADVRRGSNQDEDKEFDEDAEIDREVPQLEIGNWGIPYSGQSPTSRLHRHISQSSTEAGNLQVSIPPPKEFLTQGSLKPAVSKQHDAGQANANAGQNCHGEKTRSAGVPKSASNGRRRTAADLEWSDGGETPDVRLVPTCAVSVV